MNKQDREDLLLIVEAVLDNYLADRRLSKASWITGIS